MLSSVSQLAGKDTLPPNTAASFARPSALAVSAQMTWLLLAWPRSHAGGLYQMMRAVNIRHVAHLFTNA